MDFLGNGPNLLEIGYREATFGSLLALTSNECQSYDMVGAMSRSHVSEIDSNLSK
jgi:hypothetical protein